MTCFNLPSKGFFETCIAELRIRCFGFNLGRGQVVGLLKFIAVIRRKRSVWNLDQNVQVSEIYLNARVKAGRNVTYFEVKRLNDINSMPV